jgi:hypothetical protein
LNPGTEMIEPSSIGVSPRNDVTIIRCCARYSADPVAFEEFSQMQMEIKSRTSIQIETVLFFGLFASRRECLLEEIELTQSKRLDSRSLLRLFRQKLKGLVLNSVKMIGLEWSRYSSSGLRNNSVLGLETGFCPWLTSCCNFLSIEKKLVFG